MCCPFGGACIQKCTVQPCNHWRSFMCSRRPKDLKQSMIMNLRLQPIPPLTTPTSDIHYTKTHLFGCNLVRAVFCSLWLFLPMKVSYLHYFNKKTQLSLTNPRDAKACQKLLQLDVLTTLSLTILDYLHSFSCCCVRNLRNPEKFTKNSDLWSTRSSKVIDLGVNGKPICDFILVINSNFSRICYRFRDIHG